MPRSEARMPAASPSYSTVTLSEYRLISRIWPSVSEVPDEATTFFTPPWCRLSTSR